MRWAIATGCTIGDCRALRTLFSAGGDALSSFMVAFGTNIGVHAVTECQSRADASGVKSLRETQPVIDERLTSYERLDGAF